MISKILNKITCIQRMNILMKPKYNFGQGNPFHFYSFEEEIHKLKLAQDQLKNKQQQQQNQQPSQTAQAQDAIISQINSNDNYEDNNLSCKTILKRSIEELNRLYREGNIFNLECNDEYIPLKDSKEFKQYIKNMDYSQLDQQNQIRIIQSLNVVEQVIQIKRSKENNLNQVETQHKFNYHEQSLILEAFLHNVLLSLLCDQQQLYKQMHTNQAKGPLIDEMFILAEYIQTFISNKNNNQCIEIVSENPQLFKYITKTFEILQIQPSIAIPFIQSYLDLNIQDAVGQNSSQNQINKQEQQQNKQNKMLVQGQQKQQQIIKQNQSHHYQTLHDISLLLLPISDYVFECGYYASKFGQGGSQLVLDLSSVSKRIRNLLKESKEMNQKKQNREEVSTLCKTLFCMVRINQGHGKVCLDLAEALLASNYESLTEIEMTSIIYSITKLTYDKESEILFERKIKREMPNLIFDYETKIEKMLQTRYFHQARVPYILYCLQNSSKYRPAYRRNQINYICQSLISIVMKNFEKYKASEITTIIYSLKMINSAFQKDIEILYRSYFLKLALDQQKRDTAKQQQQQQQKQNIQKQNTTNLIHDNLNEDSQEDEDFLNNHMNKEFLSENNIGQSIRKTAENSKKIKESQAVVPQKQQKNATNNNIQNVKNQGFNIKMQKVRNTMVYFEQLQAVDILCLFIGIRNNDKNNTNNNNNQQQSQNNNHNNNNNSLNSIFVINQQLFQLFLNKQQSISNNLKIKILYEVSYNHPELLDSYLFEKYFKDWIVQIADQLNTLNNHDLIALGYIMKKFARLFAYHIDFWIKFTEESNKRTYHNPVENQRIKVCILNMQNFYHKCLNSSPSLQKQEKNRIKRLQIVYDLMQSALSKLNSVESNKNHEKDNENFYIDSEQYN